MVQDISDPEFYAGTYTYVDPSTKGATTQTARYQDCVRPSMDGEGVIDSDVTPMERLPLHVVPVPGAPTSARSTPALDLPLAQCDLVLGSLHNGLLPIAYQPSTGPIGPQLEVSTSALEKHSSP